MNAAAIRQQLHSYLEVADDKKVKAFFTMMEDDIKESALEYTPAFKKELDARHASYKNGSATMVTSAESKKRIQKLLKAGRSK